MMSVTWGRMGGTMAAWTSIRRRGRMIGRMRWISRWERVVGPDGVKEVLIKMMEHRYIYIPGHVHDLTIIRLSSDGQRERELGSDVVYKNLNSITN